MPLGKSSLRTPALLGAGHRARPRCYLGAAREAMRLGTKPECALESVTKEAWYTSLLRIRIDERRARRLIRLAQQVWCALRGKGGRKNLRTKPECLTKSAGYVEMFLSRIHFRIDDRHSGRGLGKGVVWLRPEAAGRRISTSSYVCSIRLRKNAVLAVVARLCGRRSH